MSPAKLPEGSRGLLKISVARVSVSRDARETPSLSSSRLISKLSLSSFQREGDLDLIICYFLENGLADLPP